MGIFHPTIDNLLIHNEYVTMPGYSQSRSPLFPRPKWFVNTLPPFMPDIGGSSQKYGGGGVKGGGGGGVTNAGSKYPCVHQPRVMGECCVS